MSVVDAVAVVMFAGVIAYAVFAGADFGSGVWDLTAGDAEEGGDLRRLVDHSIGPVWEANHVWLIFVLVFLWTGFPDGFAAIMRTLYVPFCLAAVGIVLRGAGFAFRKYAAGVGQARIFGATFAVSSVITPFFLGAIVGAIVSGRVPADGTGDLWTSWTGPSSVLGGTLAVLTCSFLAATFLAAEAAALGREDLRQSCRSRALGAGIVTGGAALLGIVPLAFDAEALFERLAGRGAAFVAVSALAGAAALWLIWQDRLGTARVFAVVAVAAVVAGWGASQYPWLLVDELTLDEAAGSDDTMWALLVGFGAAAALVVPSLAYLFSLIERGEIGAEPDPAPEPGIDPDSDVDPRPR